MNRQTADEIAKKKATEAYAKKFHTGATLEFAKKDLQYRGGSVLYEVIIRADDMALYTFMFDMKTGVVEFSEYYRETFTKWREDSE